MIFFNFFPNLLTLRFQGFEPAQMTSHSICANLTGQSKASPPWKLPAYPKMKLPGTLEALSGRRWSFNSPSWSEATKTPLQRSGFFCVFWTRCFQYASFAEGTSDIEYEYIIRLQNASKLITWWPSTRTFHNTEENQKARLSLGLGFAWVTPIPSLSI